MNSFQQYRETYEKMLMNRNVYAWRRKIEVLEDSLEEARRVLSRFEEPYQTRMDELKERITQDILVAEQSFSSHGVVASYRKPRANTSWKSVAMEYNPPDELIEKFTNYSPASVTVKIEV